MLQETLGGELIHLRQDSFELSDVIQRSLSIFWASIHQTSPYCGDQEVGVKHVEDS